MAGGHPFPFCQALTHKGTDPMLLDLIDEVSNLRRARARREIDGILNNCRITPSAADHDTAARVLDLLPAAGLTLDDVRAKLTGSAVPTRAHLAISARHGYGDGPGVMYALSLLENPEHLAQLARHTFEPHPDQPADEFEELLLIVGANGRDAASRRVAPSGSTYDESLKLLEKHGVPKLAERDGDTGAAILAAQHSPAAVRLAIATAKYRKRKGTLAEPMAAAIVRALKHPNNH